MVIPENSNYYSLLRAIDILGVRGLCAPLTAYLRFPHPGEIGMVAVNPKHIESSIWVFVFSFGCLCPPPKDIVPLLFTLPFYLL